MWRRCERINAKAQSNGDIGQVCGKNDAQNIMGKENFEFLKSYVKIVHCALRLKIVILSVLLL